MALRGLIGFSMRVYRRSPFCPRLGKSLAKVLAQATRRRAREPVAHELDGIRFELDLNEVIDASLYYAGTWEAGVERAIAAIVKPGMVAIDVGANIGCHTFGLARLVGPAGRVVAVEPTARAFMRLLRNADLNSFENLTCLRVGCGAKDLGPAQIAFQSSYRLDGKPRVIRETVVLTTVDAIVREQQLPRVDFMKVDVDGYEGKVFQGAVETLRRFRPWIVFEITPATMRQNGDDALDLLNTLRALGYAFATEAGEPVTELAASAAANPTVTRSQNLVAVPSKTSMPIRATRLL